MEGNVIDRLKKEIEKFSPTVETEEVGRVISAGDGIAEIEGLSGAAMSEMVLFDEREGKKLSEALESGDALFGLILNLEEDVVKVVVLGGAERVREGMLVRRLNRLLSIPVSEALIGRVITPLGEALDGKGVIAGGNFQPIEREAYGVIDRQSVNTPLHTGIKAIDAMVPIGRGQRELIIGDRYTGKTTVSID